MKFALNIMLVFFRIAVFAQEIQFQQEQYPFPVTFYGVEPQIGFFASSQYYHHDFADIDNDGDYDIVMSGVYNKEYLFINNG